MPRPTQLLASAVLCILACFVLMGCSNGVSIEETTFSPDTPDDLCPPGFAECDETGCIDIMTNPRFCGGCSPCVGGAPNTTAQATCTDGSCNFFCAQGFADLDADLGLGAGGNGCECQILPESCDGLDNDCDGEVDEGVSNACGGCAELPNALGAPCGDPNCGGGTFECVDNNLDLLKCSGDGLNDCGGCGELEGTLGEVCAGEACSIFACVGTDLTCLDDTRLFFKDSDGDTFGTDESARLCAAEAPFTATRDGDCDDTAALIYPGAPDLCDGLDNDCDGDTDADDTDNFLPEQCPEQRGVCAGASAACIDGQTQPCDDDAYADHTQTFDPAPELACGDGQDNDCDGDTDENCCAQPSDGQFTLGRPLDDTRQAMPSVALSPTGQQATAVWIETDDDNVFDPPQQRLSLGLMGTLDRSGAEIGQEQGLTLDSPAFVRIAGHDNGFDVIGLDGVLLMLSRMDRGGRLITTTEVNDNARQPAIAARADGGAMIAYAENRTFCDGLMARRVLPNNTLGSPVELTTCGVFDPAVALSDDRGLVIGQAEGLGFNNLMRWATVDADLEVGETQTLDMDSDRFQPTAAVVDAGFLIAFVAEDNQNQDQIFVARLAIDGSVANGEPRAFTTGDATVRSPILVQLQNGAGLAWVEGDGPSVVQYQRLDNAGQSVGGRLTLKSGTHLHHKPIALSPGPSQRNPEQQWFALATSESRSNNVVNTPDRLILSFFTAAGQAICFNE